MERTSCDSITVYSIKSFPISILRIFACLSSSPSYRPCEAVADIGNLPLDPCCSFVTVLSGHGVYLG